MGRWDKWARNGYCVDFGCDGSCGKRAPPPEACMGRPGQFAAILEPGLAVADCCGQVVFNETGRPFRHPVYCDGECPVSQKALQEIQESGSR